MEFEEIKHDIARLNENKKIEFESKFEKLEEQVELLWSRNT